MSTAIHRQVETLRAGRDPTFIARLESGWAVLGATQVIDGYSLLLPDPVVATLNALPVGRRERFLADVGRLGDALLEVTGAVRINYAIFGNLEPALHAHLFPRYAHEPDPYRTAHPWTYDWSKARAFDAQKDGVMIERLRRVLAR
jgi:diadenosine tetraphosphate (Ap4A) HIT family hydrolase